LISRQTYPVSSLIIPDEEPNADFAIRLRHSTCCALGIVAQLQPPFEPDEEVCRYLLPHGGPISRTVTSHMLTARVLTSCSFRVGLLEGQSFLVVNDWCTLVTPITGLKYGDNSHALQCVPTHSSSTHLGPALYLTTKCRLILSSVFD
jgi:hypothetical protein